MAILFLEFVEKLASIFRRARRLTVHEVAPTRLVRHLGVHRRLFVRVPKILDYPQMPAELQSFSSNQSIGFEFLANCFKPIWREIEDMER